jgi:Ni,Fe-hydrogenase III small subunit
MSVGALVLLVLGVVLLVTAVVLARSSSRLPWPAIVVAALTSAVCFTVGGDAARDTSGPSIATVMASITGFLSVVAAVLALVPQRSRNDGGPARRTPILLSAGGIALGGIGLLLTLLTD